MSTPPPDPAELASPGESRPPERPRLWSRPPKALLLVLVGLFITAFGIRWTANLKRPLESDELITLKLYSAFGYDSTAERDATRPKVNWARLVRGGGKAFLNPWNSNHHVVHSLAVSASQTVFGLSAKACRMPAMLASIALSLALCWLVWKETGNLWLAGAIGVAAIFHPYFMYFGQTARGYSLTALLIVMHTAVIQELRRQSRSWLHVISGALAVLIFLNLVSTLTMWVVPLYLSLLLTATQRRRWMLEMLIVFSILALFILAELPQIIRTQVKYGVPVRSLEELMKIDLFNFLAPGWWLPAFVIGLAGCIWGAWRRQWMGMLCLIAIVLTVGFVVAGKKMPYARTYGCFIVFSWFGLMQAWQLLGRRPWRWAIPLLVVVPVALALPGVRDYRSPSTHSTALAEIARDLSRHGYGESQPFVLLPWIFGEESTYYLPEDRFSLHPPKKAGPATVYFSCRLVDGRLAFRTQYADFFKEELVYWTVPEEWSRFSIWRRNNLNTLAVPMDAVPSLPEKVEEGACGLIVFEPTDRYFNISRYIADGLKTEQPPWTVRMSMMHYLQPPFLMVFFSNREEFTMARQVITTLQEHTPGNLTCLTYRTP